MLTRTDSVPDDYPAIKLIVESWLWLLPRVSDTAGSFLIACDLMLWFEIFWFFREGFLWNFDLTPPWDLLFSDVIFSPTWFTFVMLDVFLGSRGDFMRILVCLLFTFGESTGIPMG